MIDKLHEDLNRVIKKPYILEKEYKQDESEENYFKEYMKNFKARNDSFIVDLFYGIFRSATTGPSCNFLCLRFEPFNMLTVPVRGVTDSKDFSFYFQSEFSLYDLIKYQLPISENDTLSSVKEVFCEKKGISPGKLGFYLFNREDRQFSLLGDEHLRILDLERRPQIFTFLIQHESEILKGEEPIPISFDVEGINVAETVGIRSLVRAPRQCHVRQLYTFFYSILSKMFPYYIDPFDSYFKKDSTNRLFDLILGGEKLDFDVSGQFTDIRVDLTEGVVVKARLLNPAIKRNHSFRDLKIEEEKLVVKQASIYDCLDAFTQHETLDEDNQWYCPKCKDHRKARVQLTIKQLPEILIIHLKRFKKTQAGVSKFTETIDFPIEGLDVSKYITDSGQPLQPVKYNLFATINHYGNLYKGHYKAFAQSANHKVWVEFDDDELKDVKLAKDFINDKPYILFYRKQPG